MSRRHSAATLPNPLKGEQFETVFEVAPVPMLLFDDSTIVRRVNRAAAILGQHEPMINKRGGEALHCQHHYASPGGCGTGLPCATCAIRQLVANTALRRETFSQVDAVVTLMVEHQPMERELRLTTTPLDLGSDHLVLTCIEDMTQRNQAMRQLTHQSLHDTLTGLPNRQLFHDRLEMCLDKAQRHPGYHFALLFLDVDGFKTVNDTLGHVVGDELLVSIAHRLTGSLRSTDTIAAPDHLLARMGGDEFTIILDQLRAPEDAYAIAHRLTDELRAPYRIAGKEFTTTLSVGVVLHQPGHRTAREILRDADAAMYSAKAGGKARCSVYHAPTTAT